MMERVHTEYIEREIIGEDDEVSNQSIGLHV